MIRRKGKPEKGDSRSLPAPISQTKQPCPVTRVFFSKRISPSICLSNLSSRGIIPLRACPAISLTNPTFRCCPRTLSCGGIFRLIRRKGKPEKGDSRSLPASISQTKQPCPVTRVFFQTNQPFHLPFESFLKRNYPVGASTDAKRRGQIRKDNSTEGKETNSAPKG